MQKSPLQFLVKFFKDHSTEPNADSYAQHSTLMNYTLMEVNTNK